MKYVPLPCQDENDLRLGAEYTATQASTKIIATVRGHNFMGKHNPQTRHRRDLQPHAT